MSQLGFHCCDNAPVRSSLWKERSVWLPYPTLCPSMRNSSRRRCRTHRENYLLTCSQARIGSLIPPVTTCPRERPPQAAEPSHINQENAPWTCPMANQMKMIPQLRVPLPRHVKMCVKWTKTNQTKKADKIIHSHKNTV